MKVEFFRHPTLIALAALVVLLATYVGSAAIVARIKMPSTPTISTRWGGDRMMSTIVISDFSGAIIYNRHLVAEMRWKPLDTLYRPLLSRAKVDPETGDPNLMANFLGYGG